MYHIRYFAIGHSYLLHGPFRGWQMEGFWGMAASEPQRDYFHTFQALLQENLDCRIEAVAQNYADYERRCVAGATSADYEKSHEYAKIKKVLEEFKPNLISVFIGDGNVIAKDADSLKLFYETLYAMIAKYKCADTVVLCPCMKPHSFAACEPIAVRYGFLPLDFTFLHEKKGYENPYYAFRDYPEYDALAASGAVEFRTHPNDLGHRTMAERMADAALDAIRLQIAEGNFDNDYHCYTEHEKLKLQEGKEASEPTVLTEPSMNVCFHGFNVRAEGDCVVLGSAPETGASVRLPSLNLPTIYKTLTVELTVECEEGKTDLIVTVGTKERKYLFTHNVADGAMQVYETDLCEVTAPICEVDIRPRSINCVIKIRKIAFA